MTKKEVLLLANDIEIQSGMNQLSAEQSWHAQEILGHAKYSLYLAAQELRNAAVHM